MLQHPAAVGVELLYDNVLRFHLALNVERCVQCALFTLSYLNGDLVVCASICMKECPNRLLSTTFSFGQQFAGISFYGYMLAFHEYTIVAPHKTVQYHTYSTN